MNRRFTASKLLKIAKELVAIEFPSDDAMKKYLKDHPDADKSNHSVVKKHDSDSSTSTKEPAKHESPKSKPHVKAKPKASSIEKVSNVLKAHGMEGNEDELHEIAGFKKTLGQRVPEKDVGKWYVRNGQKLKKDFIANMNASNYSSPEAFKNAQKRIQAMPVGDFAKILAAMTSEEEEG